MAEEFDFEWFGKKGAPTRTTRPRLGIQKRGQYSLNEAAVAILGHPTHIKLAYDKSRNVIGIRAASPDEPGAYPMRKQPNSVNYIFSGTAFSNHYGIPIGWSRRYWAEARGDVLTADLNQEPDDTHWPPKERDEFGRISTAGNESAK